MTNYSSNEVVNPADSWQI